MGRRHQRGLRLEMIANANDVPLLELAKHLGVASQLETATEPAFWRANSSHVFLSHLASMKANVGQLTVSPVRLCGARQPSTSRLLRATAPTSPNPTSIIP